MKKLAARVLLALASTAVFFVLAELGYRALASEEVDARNLHQRYRLYYQDADRQPLDYASGLERGLVVPNELPGMPRPRTGWAPNQVFYLCYTGIEGPRRAYFDAQGCVECRINSAGIRDREEVVGPKPPGQRRIVCLGDSFTFGWGVKVEDAWPRLVEAGLRQEDDGIRTVNCGAALGAIYADEYAVVLEEAFARFEPDVVFVTLCLNDLIPSSNALAHQEPAPWILRHSRILRDLFQSYALQAQLSIDPDRDLVQELLDLPDEYYPVFAPWAAEPVGPGRKGLWPGGGVQAALLRMRDWCAERGIRYGVAIWPYFQGLGKREHYPFTKLHRLVGDFCGEHGIAFLDVLPVFRGQVAHTSDLWVSPADYHGNEIAQRMAAPLIRAFLADLLAP